MQRNIFKILIIAVVLAVIFAAGVKVVGTKNYHAAPQAFIPTTKDVAIYGYSDKGAMTLYKAALDGTSAAPFYSTHFDPKSEAMYSVVSVNNGRLFVNATLPDKEVKILTLDGQVMADPNVQYDNPFREQGGWIISADGTLKMESMPISPQSRIIVQTRKAEEVATIKSDEAFDSPRDIRPVGFSKDNQVVYFVKREFLTEGMEYASEYFYAYHRQIDKAEEIFHSDFTKNPDAPRIRFFDSKNELAYLKAGDRILQLDPKTRKTVEIATVKSLLYGDMYFSDDAKTIFVERVSRQFIDHIKTPMAVIDIQTKQKKSIPVFGDFVAVSSDGKFLIYRASSRTPYKNAQSKSMDQEELVRDEIHSFNLETSYDALLVINEQIVNTFRPKQKEFLFLGLITP